MLFSDTIEKRATRTFHAKSGLMKPQKCRGGWYKASS